MAEQGARADQDTEQAVLGAMLQNNDVFDDITAVLAGPQDFHHPRHSELYRAMTALREHGPVDPLTLTHHLEPADLKRLGGADYLQTCMQAAPLISAGPTYARQLRGLAKLRAAQQHAASTAHWAASYTAEHADELIDRVQAGAAELALTDPQRSDVPTWDTIAADTFDDIERIEHDAKTGTLPGIPTGWSDLDRILNNLQGGQVIVIAGRPGVGKSVAGRGIAQHNAMRRKAPVLLFSLEMSRRECAMALLSAGAGVPLHNIRSGTLTDHHWSRLARYLADTGDAPLMIDDTPGAGLAHARAVMQRLIRNDRKPHLIVWDYLQLTDVPGYDGRRQEAVGALSRGFKLLAKEYDIPVVLISQLNRGPEQRQDKRPVLADLRESGAIEQDSDVVILLHRDDYHDKEHARAGELDLIVAKNRHGATDTVTVAAQLHLQRLMDMALT